MATRGVWPSGIQIGPFAVHGTYYCQTYLHFINTHMQHSLFLHAEERAPHSGYQKWMTSRVDWPWGIQIGPFGVYKTYLWKIDFRFINKPHAAFPFPACRGKAHYCWHQKWKATRGVCMNLGHSSWVIWSPQNLFLQTGFRLYYKAICSIPFSCMQRKGHPTVDPKSEWNQGVDYLVHSNQTICSPQKPIFP